MPGLGVCDTGTILRSGWSRIVAYVLNRSGFADVSFHKDNWLYPLRHTYTPFRCCRVLQHPVACHSATARAPINFRFPNNPNWNPWGSWVQPIHCPYLYPFPYLCRTKTVYWNWAEVGMLFLAFGPNFAAFAHSHTVRAACRSKYTILSPMATCFVPVAWF